MWNATFRLISFHWNTTLRGPSGGGTFGGRAGSFLFGGGGYQRLLHPFTASVYRILLPNPLSAAKLRDPVRDVYRIRLPHLFSASAYRIRLSHPFTAPIYRTRLPDPFSAAKLRDPVRRLPHPFTGSAYRIRLPDPLTASVYRTRLPDPLTDSNTKKKKKSTEC